MTFKIKDFKPGDIVRDSRGWSGEVLTVGKLSLLVLFQHNDHPPFEGRVLPRSIVEIEQVMVGERAIGI